MKARRLTALFLLCALCAALTGAQAQLPSFAGTTTTAAAQAGADISAELLTENYLHLTINGEELVLTDGGSFLFNRTNEAHLTFACSTPLGTPQWWVSFVFDLGTAPGTVFSNGKNGNNGFLFVSQAANVIYSYRPAKSAYTLTVDSRSADWLTYTGTLEGTLYVDQDSPSKGAEPLVIENGYFTYSFKGD